MRKPPTNTQEYVGQPWGNVIMNEVCRYVMEEFDRGAMVNGELVPFLTAHEALAKIEEEFLELRREVYEKKRIADGLSWDARREEAAHVAAVAIKFLASFWTITEKKPDE